MKKNYSAMIGSLVATALLVATPALAETTLGVRASTTATITPGGVTVGAQAGATARTALVGRAKDRADQEITRRVNALNALSVRVNAMKRLSDDEKASLSSSITAQIGTMNDLQAKIDADAGAESTSSLKTDIKSITVSYRIFALVMPQAAIAAAADRIETVVSTMNDVSAKLQARITDAQNAGNDTTAAASALVDMNAKVSDADVQAKAAISETASLTPDGGDATKMAANTAALKDARAKIHAAQQDLVAARKDAGTIVKALAAFNTSASASAAASTSAQ